MDTPNTPPAQTRRISLSNTASPAQVGRAEPVDRLKTLADFLQSQPEGWGLLLRGRNSTETRNLLANASSAEGEEALITQRRHNLDHDLSILRAQQNEPGDLRNLASIENAIIALHECRDRLEGTLSFKKSGLHLLPGNYRIENLLDDAHQELVAQLNRRNPPQLLHAPRTAPDKMDNDQLIAVLNPVLEKAMTSTQRTDLIQSLANIALGVSTARVSRSGFFGWFAVQAISSARAQSAPELTVELFDTLRTSPAAESRDFWREHLDKHLVSKDPSIPLAQGMSHASNETPQPPNGSNEAGFNTPPRG